MSKMFNIDASATFRYYNFYTQSYRTACKKLIEMNKTQIIDDVFNRNGSIVKTADFSAAGLSNADVSYYCRQGYIERIRNGFYKQTEADAPKEELLLSKCLPQGVVCAESALYYYGYSSFVPRVWTVAVPRSFSRSVKAMGNFPLKAYYVQNEFHQYGVTTGIFNGVELPVYDRERTICDCFKYRTKLDSEIFNKAVKAYAADPEKNLVNLSKYAKDMKIYKKMMTVMEVLLNG